MYRIGSRTLENFGHAPKQLGVGAQSTSLDPFLLHQHVIVLKMISKDNAVYEMSGDTFHPGTHQQKALYQCT